MGLSENKDWRSAVRDMLEIVVKNYELPKGTLYLSDNYGQTENVKGLPISHTVCIWEPNYPPVKNEKPSQNKVVLTIVPSTVKSRPDDLDLSLRIEQELDVHEFLPGDAEILPQTKSDKSTGTIKVRFNCTSITLVDYIRRNTEYCIKKYTSKASRFGCCSMFNECSDSKKCVHQNKLYSKACMYRDNLEQGRIFYGENKSI